MPTYQTRSFCFTLNNPSELDIVSVNDLASDAQYLIYGTEVGANGTKHLQGFVYFATKVSFNKVKKHLARAHIEPAKGNVEQNVAYCSKDGDVVEHGVRPTQGKRNDIQEAYRVVKATHSMKEVVAIMPNFQAIKCAEAYLKYHEAPRDWKPEVRWYYGPTGEGKTKLAREWLGECYTCLESGKFWEGYDAHESVLIDDMRKDFCKFHVLLRILDRYEYRVEVKGASRQLRARKIAITAPMPPAEMFDTREDVGQLLRRIDSVHRIVDGIEVPADATI